MKTLRSIGGRCQTVELDSTWRIVDRRIAEGLDCYVFERAGGTEPHHTHTTTIVPVKWFWRLT